MNKKNILELLNKVDYNTEFDILIEATNMCDYKGTYDKNNPGIKSEYTIKFTTVTDFFHDGKD